MLCLVVVSEEGAEAQRLHIIPGTESPSFVPGRIVKNNNNNNKYSIYCNKIKCKKTEKESSFNRLFTIV